MVRSSRSATLAAGVVLALVVGLAGVLALPATAPAYAESARAGIAAGRSAQPVLARSFPDPTAVRWEGRFVAVGTGPPAPAPPPRAPPALAGQRQGPGLAAPVGSQRQRLGLRPGAGA